LDRYLVLAASEWRMVDEKSGEISEGCSVFYVDTDDSTEGNREGQVGNKPLKITGPKGLTRPSLLVLPAVVEMSFKQKPGKDGKPTLQLTKVGKVFPIDLATLASEAA